MGTYIKRLKSGRVSHYLRPIKTTTGSYAIETSNLSDKHFEANMNYPLFKSHEDAETYLRERFERI